MATFVQRAGWIADAVVNGTATASQKQRIAAAFKPALIHDPSKVYTNAEIAEFFVKDIRNFIMQRVKAYEAAEAIRLAHQNTSDQVDTDFSEAP